MKEFGTHDAVDNMLPCRKKPIIVHAKQMTEPFKVNTLEGNKDGKTGDYLMRGIKGELYPCEKEIFELTYDWVLDIPEENR